MTHATPPPIEPRHNHYDVQANVERTTHSSITMRDRRIRHIIIAGLAIYFGWLALVVIGSAIEAVEGEGSVGKFGVMVVFGPILMTVISSIYIAPWAIAYVRQHRNLIPIAIVNITFGWMLLGWIGALAWAFSDQNKS